MEWWNCKAFSAVTICFALTIMSYVTFVDVSNDPLATEVLIFCVEFQELSHLRRDLSQAEKKINFVTS